MEKSKLNLRFLSDGKAMLLDDYIYDINGYQIKVFKGFITDGASIPKCLQSIYNPFGKWIKSAVIHDYLYSKYNNTGINRKLADKIFYHIMKETEVNSNTRKKFYKAVRYFGAMSWQDKIENEGYKDQAIIDHTKEAREYYNYWNRILKI
jgi:hypothetical protein|nr:MAG TPA: Protein of unknown function (DUF1353) [Caudoviricetes sp.]